VKDALSLFQKYDINKNGSLDMNEFARAFLGKEEFDGVTNMRMLTRSRPVALASTSFQL